MRTLESMAEGQATENSFRNTLSLCPAGPQAWLVCNKTELEDLGLKYTEPEIFGFHYTKAESH